MKNKTPTLHYIHYLSQSTRERLVGIFFITALSIISALIFVKIQSAKMFDDAIYYHAYMNNAQGISTETLVNVSGIEVGKVAAIDITDENKIHITFFVYQGFAKLIRQDSSGALSKLSLIGNATIIISAGNPKLPLLAPNSTLHLEEPVTTDELIESIKPVINNLESTVADLAKLIKAIDPQTLHDSNQSFSVILKNIEHISHAITSGEGALGKALYDSQQAKQITQLLNAFIKTLNSIEQRANEAQPLINALEDTVQGVQKVWPLSTTLPQPSGELMIQEAGHHD